MLDGEVALDDGDEVDSGDGVVDSGDGVIDSGKGVVDSDDGVSDADNAVICSVGIDTGSGEVTCSDDELDSVPNSLDPTNHKSK